MSIDQVIRGSSVWLIITSATLATLCAVLGGINLKELYADRVRAENADADFCLAMDKACKSAAYSVHLANALLEVKQALEPKLPQSIREIIDDALAELNDSRTAVKLCFTWLTDILHDANKHWWIDPATGENLRNARFIVPTKLALVHSEISEALEAHRKKLEDDKLPHLDGFTVELADALIRIFDLAGATFSDVGTAAAEKMAYNAKRLDHQATARLAENGKRY